MEQRLQKLLAAGGVASRRDAENLILSGRITVNGKTVTELGAKADPETDIVALDGKPISVCPERAYVLLNKPRGYTSTRSDPHARRVITELVKDIGVPLYPVGRLDVDTEGLIILTNDGDFAFKMTHPRHNIEKTYRAEVRGLVTRETMHQLAAGVLLEDGMTSPAKVRVPALNTARQTSIVEMVLTEGRKRQVRRMLESVGHPVTRLTRSRLGNLTLGKLKSGEWRFLKPEEVQKLLALA